MFKAKNKKVISKIDDWVDKEIKLVLSQVEEGLEGDYIKECYNSAKEAYSTIAGKGHSGMSISLTKAILDRLMDRKPLTPITEDNFKEARPLDWGKLLEESNLKEVYQCPRYSALFKYVGLDGSITYSDNNRVVTIDRNGAGCSSGMITKIVDTMFPVTLPYYPSTPYKVYTIEFTYDPDTQEVKLEPGIYNAVYFSFILTPDSEIIDLDTFLFEDENIKDVDSALLKSELKKEVIINGLSPKIIKS